MVVIPPSSVTTALKDSERDYIIGVDVFDDNGKGKGGGQFAVLIRKGQISAIVWKSYPKSRIFKKVTFFEKAQKVSNLTYISFLEP